MDEDVLSTPGHLISLAARGFARLSEARLKPLGFGVGHLPVLVALQDGKASTQRDLARFARVEQPPMAQMLARMERDGLIERTRDPATGAAASIVLTKTAQKRMPEAIETLFQGNREALAGFTAAETAQIRRSADAADRKPEPNHQPRPPVGDDVAFGLSVISPIRACRQKLCAVEKRRARRAQTRNSERECAAGSDDLPICDVLRKLSMHETMIAEPGSTLIPGR